MASVYKRRHRGRNGRIADAKCFTVECKIGDSFERVPAFSDKKASEELGRKVERLAALRASRRMLR